MLCRISSGCKEAGLLLLLLVTCAGAVHETSMLLSLLLTRGAATGGGAPVEWPPASCLICTICADCPSASGSSTAACNRAAAILQESRSSAVQEIHV